MQKYFVLYELKLNKIQLLYIAVTPKWLGLNLDSFLTSKNAYVSLLYAFIVNFKLKNLPCHETKF